MAILSVNFLFQCVTCMRVCPWMSVCVSPLVSAFFVCLHVSMYECICQLDFFFHMSACADIGGGTPAPPPTPCSTAQRKKKYIYTNKPTKGLLGDARMVNDNVIKFTRSFERTLSFNSLAIFSSDHQNVRRQYSERLLTSRLCSKSNVPTSCRALRGMAQSALAGTTLKALQHSDSSDGVFECRPSSSWPRHSQIRQQMSPPPLPNLCQCLCVCMSVCAHVLYYFSLIFLITLNQTEMFWASFHR